MFQMPTRTATSSEPATESATAETSTATTVATDTGSSSGFTLPVAGATVGELLADLTTRYDGLRKHLYTDEGKLRNFVNVYLNDEDIRYLQREATPVKSGDTLSIVPSVAGGANDVTPVLRARAVRRRRQ